MFNPRYLWSSGQHTANRRAYGEDLGFRQTKQSLADSQMERQVPGQRERRNSMSPGK